MFTRDKFEADLASIETKSERLADSFRLVKTRIDNSQPLIVYLVNTYQFMRGNEILTVEYHVVLSESFSCPVLYLNVSRPNGSLLSYNELYQLFGIDTPKNGPEMVFTQQDHPVLNRPFFYLHPCKTNEWMRASEIDVPGSKK